MTIIELLIWSCLGGVINYIGGEINKIIKRIGVPLVATIVLLRLGIVMPWWAWLISYGMMYGMMTTYWSEAYGADDDVEGREWILTGLTYGVALIMVPLCMGNWFMWGVRVGGLGVLIWMVSVVFGHVFVESFLRGFLIIASLKLLSM